MRRGPLPPAWSDAARALLPAALLVLAAAVPISRPFVLGGLVLGTAIAIGRAAPVRWAWAATVPAAVGLTFGRLAAPEATPSLADCASPTSPVALWRLGEAALVLGTAVVLAQALRATRASAWLARPHDRVVRLAGIGGLAAAVAGLLVGSALAAPFFGGIRFDATNPAAFVPALVFATANGVMEEVAYRGVLMGWLGRVSGLWPAAILQAVVFGLAHASGADVGGSPIVLGLALGLGGFVAGVITIRTRSLAIPMAIHIGLDVALYFGLACRMV